MKLCKTREIAIITGRWSYSDKIWRGTPLTGFIYTKYNDNYRLGEFSKRDIRRNSDCESFPGDI